jgi:uncharacterized membrane-anchored protein
MLSQIGVALLEYVNQSQDSGMAAPQARRSAAEALKLAPASPGVEIEAALALAMAGDTARAESIAHDLGERFPLDTQMQSLWLPAIHAQLALDRKKPAVALNALQTASNVELGAIFFVANLSCLYPTYVRGEAYLAAGQARNAAAEFQTQNSKLTPASSDSSFVPYDMHQLVASLKNSLAGIRCAN